MLNVQENKMKLEAIEKIKGFHSFRSYSNKLFIPEFDAIVTDQITNWVLRLRFGLFGSQRCYHCDISTFSNESRSLENVADEISGLPSDVFTNRKISGITRERVRQIEAKGLKVLRSAEYTESQLNEWALVAPRLIGVLFGQTENGKVIAPVFDDYTYAEKTVHERKLIDLWASFDLNKNSTETQKIKIDDNGNISQVNEIELENLQKMYLHKPDNFQCTGYQDDEKSYAISDNGEIIVTVHENSKFHCDICYRIVQLKNPQIMIKFQKRKPEDDYDLKSLHNEFESAFQKFISGGG